MLSFGSIVSVGMFVKYFPFQRVNDANFFAGSLVVVNCSDRWRYSTQTFFCRTVYISEH